MTEQQKQKVIDFITERDAIVENRENRSVDVACLTDIAYLNGAINVLRLAGIEIDYNSKSEKWVIY